jgi:hypothetical protein
MKPTFFLRARPRTAAERTQLAHEWWDVRSAIGACHKAGHYYAASVLRQHFNFLSSEIINEHR